MRLLQDPMTPVPSSPSSLVPMPFAPTMQRGPVQQAPRMMPVPEVRAAQSAPVSFGAFGGAGTPSAQGAPAASDGRRPGGWQDILQGIGNSLLTSPTSNPLGNFPSAFAAARQSTQGRADEARAAAKLNQTLEWLRSNDPEAAQLVEAGLMTPNEAFQWGQDRKKEEQARADRNEFNERLTGGPGSQSIGNTPLPSSTAPTAGNSQSPWGVTIADAQAAVSGEGQGAGQPAPMHASSAAQEVEYYDRLAATASNKDDRDRALVMRDNALRRFQAEQNRARPMSQEERAQFGVPANDGRVWTMTSEGPQVVGGAGVTVNVGDKQSPGWKKIDENFADTYLSWNSGGFADSMKQVEQLGEAIGILESGENVTGAIGLLPDQLRPFFNEQGAIARENVEEVVQRSLREILGAQFTEKEGERLIARAFNPLLSPQENAKRVRRLMATIVSMGDAKQDMVDYFDQNGTLQGYRGSRPSLAEVSRLAEEFGASPNEAGGMPDDITEEDINHTMQLHGLTREEVLERIGR